MERYPFNSSKSLYLAIQSKHCLHCLCSNGGVVLIVGLGGELVRWLMGSDGAEVAGGRRGGVLIDS